MVSFNYCKMISISSRGIDKSCTNVQCNGLHNAYKRININAIWLLSMIWTISMVASAMSKGNRLRFDIVDIIDIIDIDTKVKQQQCPITNEWYFTIIKWYINILTVLSISFESRGMRSTNERWLTVVITLLLTNQ